MVNSILFPLLPQSSATLPVLPDGLFLAQCLFITGYFALE